MALISTGTGDGTLLSIHPTAKAARVILYDVSGNPITYADRSALTPGVSSGVPILGSDYKNVHFSRVSHDGSVRVSADVLLLNDECEGAAYDLNKWIQTASTMAVVQTAASGMQFNSGSTLTATTGIMHTSVRTFPLHLRSGLAITIKARHTTHFPNTIIETGFGSPASATAASIANGAVWRKDGTGQYIPILSINGSEVQGTPISNATFVAAVPVTDYAVFEVQVFDDHAHFAIWTQSGALVASQDIDFSGTGTPHFSATHVQAMLRLYNSGAASTAVQMFVHSVSVVKIDQAPTKTWREQMSGQGYSSIQSPTAYTQAANWTNNAAPTTRTPSNTAAGESTLGGVISWNNAGTSFAASDTLDLILFGYQVPAPLSFFCTGINISTVNLGAANGAAPYTIQYGVAFGSSAVSLATAAPYSPMRQTLGFQRLAASAAIGDTFDRDTAWMPGTPIPVHQARFLHIFARVIGGSAATLSQVIRTTVNVNGWFE